MVVIHSYCTTGFKRAGAIFALLVLCLVLQRGPAHASDWKQKLRDGPETGVASQAAPGARAGGGNAGAFAWSGSTRGGVTSNANEDFDPVSSPYITSAQDLVVKQKAGEALIGLQLRGSIEAAFEAEEISYGELEARGSVAWAAAEGREFAVTAGSRLEHDTGFQEYDNGLVFEIRKAHANATSFATATVNLVTHASQTIEGVTFTFDDNDRTRTGLETGLELPAAGGIVPAFSVGYVGVEHFDTRDLAGYDRDSTAVFARLGARIGGDGPLSGALGLMMFNRDYDDAAFESGLFLLPEAELAWQAGEKTALELTWFADLEETPVYGVSNIRTDIVALTLSRKLGEGRALNAVLHHARDDYRGVDYAETSRGASLEFTRSVSDNASVSLAGEYERITGTGFTEAVEIWKLSLGVNTSVSR